MKQTFLEISPHGWHFDLNPSLALIRASGEDARAFLHGQLTQDIIHLNENQTSLAGYCSAKGRLYAIFNIWADGENVYLLTQRSVAKTVIKRLRMFVLRAKVVLEDISDQYDISAWVSSNALENQNAIQQNGTIRLGLMPAVIDEQTCLLAREIQVTQKNAEVNNKMPDDLELWQWLEIKAGFAPICAAISEAFVPQMVNLDRIGGVNFKKGCYPGQEIVARSHYLGKLKRRMQAAAIVFADQNARDSAYAQLKIGMDVHSSANSTQPAGQLLSFARNPLHDNQIDVLYEVSLPLLENDAQISIPNIAGVWSAQALPYLLADA